MIKKSKILFFFGGFIFWINTTIGQSERYDAKGPLDTLNQSGFIIEHQFKKTDIATLYANNITNNFNLSYVSKNDLRSDFLMPSLRKDEHRININENNTNNILPLKINSGTIGMLFPAYNSNDALMIGAALSNYKGSENKNFEYALIPAYSIRNKTMVGQAWGAYHRIVKSNTFDRLTFRAGVKSFHMNYVKKEAPSFEYAQRYIKIDPTILFRFKAPEASEKTATLSLRSLIIFEEMANFAQGGVFTGKSTERSHIHQLIYDSKIDQDVSKYDFNLTAEQQSYGEEHYLKLTTTYKMEWEFKKNKNVSFRIFAGGFLMNTQRQSGSFQNIFTRGSLALIHQGFNDYTYDEYFFSRQNQSLLQDDQVSLKNGGGFKTPVGSAHAIGMSNDIVAALNVSAHLPFANKLFPIKAYFDMGTFTTFSNEKRVNNLMYNAGFMLNYFDALTIHVPLIYSENLGNIYKSEHKNFFSRISFSLDLHKFSFWKNNFE